MALILYQPAHVDRRCPMGMHGTQIPPPAGYPGHTAPRQKSIGKTVTIVILGVTSGLLALYSCAATVTNANEGAALAGPTVTVSATETKVIEKTRSAKPSRSPERASTVGDGTWVVGEDIPAGTYKVTAPVSSDCYWGVYKSGTNGDDIIDNDIPGGGRPVVTLKKGHDFKSSECGEWARK